MGGRPNRQNLVGAAWTLVDSLKILENARHELLGTVRRMIPDNGNRVPGDLSIGLPSKVEAFLPEGTWTMLRPTLDVVRDLDRRIHYFRQGIERLADTYFPETWALRQVPPVTPIAALCYVLVIGNPRRFRNSRSIGPYLYLTEVQSLDKYSLLTPQGNEARRELVGKQLIDIAKKILRQDGPDSDLKSWGLQLSTRRENGDRTVAVTAVARKLAVLLHHLWITGKDYRPYPRRLERYSWAT